MCVTCGIGAETLGRDTKEETEEEPRFRATVAHDVGVHFGSGFYDINEDRACAAGFGEAGGVHMGTGPVQRSSGYLVARVVVVSRQHF